MNVSHLIECKYLKPEDCIHFNPYCIKNKRGSCQRSKDGLDLPQENVLAYLEEKRKESKSIEQTHIKKSGIKIFGEFTDINKFNSNIYERNDYIILKIFLKGETVLDLISYIKRMTPQNLVVNEKMRDYSDNSRYNSLKNGEVEYNVLQINWIETIDKYKGNRFGMYAMYLVEQYAKRYYDIKYITLEDHSSVDPPNNIYYKLNFNLLAWGQNSDGSYQMWKDWHKWAGEDGMGNVPGDERMISIESFESNPQIELVQKEFQIGR
jgi:hypothetical protein